MTHLREGCKIKSLINFSILSSCTLYGFTQIVIKLSYNSVIHQNRTYRESSKHIIHCLVTHSQCDLATVPALDGNNFANRYRNFRRSFLTSCCTPFVLLYCYCIFSFVQYDFSFGIKQLYHKTFKSHIEVNYIKYHISYNYSVILYMYSVVVRF